MTAIQVRADAQLSETIINLIANAVDIKSSWNVTLTVTQNFSAHRTELVCTNFGRQFLKNIKKQFSVDLSRFDKGKVEKKVEQDLV